MTEKELWKYFFDKKVSSSRPFDRDFVWIAKEDFQPIRRYFVKEFNIFHSGGSFRSLGYFAHIHAVEQGDCIFAHQDFGNLARFFPLGLLHLIFDVIPFQAIAWIRGIPQESMYVRPK